MLSSKSSNGKLILIKFPRILITKSFILELLNKKMFNRSFMTLGLCNG